MKTLIRNLIIAFSLATAALGSEPFTIEIQRNKTTKLEGQPPGQDTLTQGTISLNGKAIGTTFENADTNIPTGSYKGVMRYHSGSNFVQNPFGTLATQGDFLLEIAGVPPNRTDILFHGGNKPKHSKGCVLLGPVGFNPITGTPEVGPNHPLHILRVAFYGSEVPNASPDKSISVQVSNAPGFGTRGDSHNAAAPPAPASEPKVRDGAGGEAAAEARERAREARDKEARDKEAREKAARDKEARDKEAREKATRDREAREKAARDKEAREKAARDKNKKDKDKEIVFP